MWVLACDKITLLSSSIWYLVEDQALELLIYKTKESDFLLKAMPTVAKHRQWNYWDLPKFRLTKIFGQQARLNLSEDRFKSLYSDLAAICPDLSLKVLGVMHPKRPWLRISELLAVKSQQPQHCAWMWQKRHKISLFSLCIWFLGCSQPV